MGIVIPINVLYLKHKKRLLQKELNKVWKQNLTGLTMIIPQKTIQFYYVEVTIVLNNIHPPLWKRDIQEFFCGQEIELLEYITYVKTEFELGYHITIHKKELGDNSSNSGKIIDTRVISSLVNVVMAV